MKKQKRKRKGSALERYTYRIPQWEILERRIYLFREDFAILIRETRKRQGLTIQQVAEKAEVAIGTISNIENEKSTQFESMFKVADTLGIPIQIDPTMERVHVTSNSVEHTRNH